MLLIFIGLFNTYICLFGIAQGSRWEVATWTSAFFSPLTHFGCLYLCLCLWSLCHFDHYQSSSLSSSSRGMVVTWTSAACSPLTHFGRAVKFSLTSCATTTPPSNHPLCCLCLCLCLSLWSLSSIIITIIINKLRHNHPLHPITRYICNQHRGLHSFPIPIWFQPHRVIYMWNARQPDLQPLARLLTSQTFTGWTGKSLDLTFQLVLGCNFWLNKKKNTKAGTCLKLFLPIGWVSI